MDIDVHIENITFPDLEVSARENVHPVSVLMIQEETFLMRKYKIHCLKKNLRNYFSKELQRVTVFSFKIIIHS
jgi:hypothetical protein